MSPHTMSDLHIGRVEKLHGSSPQKQVNGVKASLVEHSNNVTAELSSDGDKVVVVMKNGSDMMAASIRGVYKSKGGVTWVGILKSRWGGLPKMEVVNDGSERPEPASGFYYAGLLRLEPTPLVGGQKTQQNKENFDITVSYEGTNPTKFQVGPDTKVDELQEKIRGRMGLPPNQYRLQHEGKPLQNGNCLGSYGIKQGSAIHTHGRNRGG